MEEYIFIIAIVLTLFNGLLFILLQRNYRNVLQKLSLGERYETEKAPLLTVFRGESLQMFLLSFMWLFLIFTFDVSMNFFLSLEQSFLISFKLGLLGYSAVHALYLVNLISFKNVKTIKMGDIIQERDILFLNKCYGNEGLDVSALSIVDTEAAKRVVQQITEIEALRSLLASEATLETHQPSEKKERLSALLQSRIEEEKRKLRPLFDDLYKAIEVKNPLQSESEELAKIEETLLSKSLYFVKN